jgi:hypothetical protein
MTFKKFMLEVTIIEIQGWIIQSVLAAHTAFMHTHTQMQRIYLNLKVRLVTDNILGNFAFDWFLCQAIQFCSETTHTWLTWNGTRKSCCVTLKKLDITKNILNKMLGSIITSSISHTLPPKLYTRRHIYWNLNNKISVFLEIKVHKTRSKFKLCSIYKIYERIKLRFM